VLTDKQAAEAKAEYEALPGTPPDAFNSRKATGDASRDEAAVREMADEMRPTGITHMRLTLDEAFGYLWMEGWKYRPHKEAPFSPQYTHTPVTANNPGARND
jgi:hypothetical protein